ncbi:MAG: hypothetical protein Q8O13_00220 [Candidatus Omnitrophota bacterium]|nr:hypothetical protein [Candidatus Omnitrophota bacterium]
MSKGYREESRMGRALEALIEKGIDCIKIIPPEHTADDTIFLALGLGEDGNSYERLCNICSSIEIDDMGITPSRMYGRDIKLRRKFRGLEPKPNYKGMNLKIEENRHYNVVGIRYVLAEVSAKTSQKHDMSYLKSAT